MKYAVGIMSGTSLDGIDVALVAISHEEQYTLIDFKSYPFSSFIKEKILLSLSKNTSNVEQICSLNFELGYLFGEAVLKICSENDLNSQSLAFVASHGQTIYHHPTSTKGVVSSTLQIGESSVISELTKTTVVSDFRYRDMSVGGQGAPIVPFSEYKLYKSEQKNRILQNIGGISNATIIPKNANLTDVIAFDSGPGNMIIDELCRHFYQKEYDKNGDYASLGKINEELLHTFMSHPFIKQPYPKTTGREDFGKQYVEQLLVQYPSIPANDWIATATLFTAKSIALAVQDLFNQNEDVELIVGGGGSYNKTLLSMLKQALPSYWILTQEDIGFSSDAKEAIAMVILGYQTLQRKPSNVPNATGASKEVILGKITYYN